MEFIEYLKSVLVGIVEGITEWLPVSSTGHMILFDEFVKLNVSAAFLEMFLVVIQLGAILAVPTLFWQRLNPFTKKKSQDERRRTLSLWGKVIVGAIPAAVLGLLLDDLLDEYLYGYLVVAAALIVYGVIFIAVERVSVKTLTASIPLTILPTRMHLKSVLSRFFHSFPEHRAPAQLFLAECSRVFQGRQARSFPSLWRYPLCSVHRGLRF